MSHCQHGFCRQGIAVEGSALLWRQVNFALVQFKCAGAHANFALVKRNLQRLPHIKSCSSVAEPKPKYNMLKVHMLRL